MLASLRKREEEVKQQMAGHLRDRDKERENHQHLEAGNPSVLRIRDPEPFGPPGSGMGKKSGSGMNNPDQSSESLETVF